ncbi:hypothetical protein DMR_15010 [Solidesulfovibrio magneticus RS-1]|uniref:Uncharacterized protein n=1 Tax=Solidesulfovibrio magneticus (strain ATCC 700980 / DSM 13731 / RS-1) TaxID=573370 RepID=C4XNL7_SOLM1|nr:hypothetical protein DMR_15010 [Solidesulfovibrio magneticus RS-1]
MKKINVILVSYHFPSSPLQGLDHTPELAAGHHGSHKHTGSAIGGCAYGVSAFVTLGAVADTDRHRRAHIRSQSWAGVVSCRYDLSDMRCPHGRYKILHPIGSGVGNGGCKAYACTATAEASIQSLLSPKQSPLPLPCSFSGDDTKNASHMSLIRWTNNSYRITLKYSSPTWITAGFG